MSNSGTAVHVIGASGRSGGALCRSLLEDGVPVVPVVRDPAKWRGAAPRVADVTDPARLRCVLQDATRVVCCAQGEDNVQRLAALLRRLPIVPLPDGGRALVQPIHQDDVTRAIRVALEHPW